MVIEGHEFRYQKDFFDGTKDLQQAKGCDVLKQLDAIQFTLGKLPQARTLPKISGIAIDFCNHLRSVVINN